MHKKKILLLFLAIISIKSFNKTIVISLGDACGIAGALRDYHLRKEAYPFDWIVSPFNAVYTMIQNDFDGFLERDFLKISNITAVIDQLNGFSFIHDFPTKATINTTENDPGTAGPIRLDFLNYLPSIKEKYNRRIARLRNALQGENKVIFIRNRDITTQQAIDLCSLLIFKFPQLDFLLVVIDDENKINSEINIHNSHIKSFYGPEYINYRHNDIAIINWEKILYELNLLKL